MQEAVQNVEAVVAHLRPDDWVAGGGVWCQQRRRTVIQLLLLRPTTTTRRHLFFLPSMHLRRPANSDPLRWCPSVKAFETELAELPIR